jgi:hypothetical protein
MLKINEEQTVLILYSLVMCLIIRQEGVTRGTGGKNEPAEL